MNLELHDLESMTRRLRELVHFFFDRSGTDPVSWAWESVPENPSLTDLYRCAVDALGSPTEAYS
jgi:hypothetical protein